jgi:hypothetical protein
MTIKVSVENFGTFIIDANKVSELISWLQANYSNPSLGEVNETHLGNQIING